MFKKSLLIMLLMAFMAPWAVKGQDLTDYTFSTGTDENQWITLTDGATTLLANAKDDDASSKTNIGFTFPFGSGSYTQFWVNSNGVFSFSSSTSSSGSSGQFSSSYVSTAQPKICGIAKDLTTGSDGYVKSELTGTAPNRVLVCEFFTTHQYVYGYSSTAATCKWQVQLYEANSKVVIVYGSAPTSAPSGYQIGLGQSSSNFWTVSPSAHTATAQTSAVSTTYSVWPGENRYYAFERPVYTCFKPQNLAATLTQGDGTIATLTWERNAQGTEDAWVLEYGTTANFEGATSVNVTGGTPSKDLTGLTAEQKYYARVKPDCDTEGNLWSDAISFTPTDAYSITVYANGTDSETSTVIPMYGNYFDEFTKSECIIPATELSTIQWGQIKSITFYAKSIGTNSSTWANTNQKVFVKEVNSTTLGGSYSGMDGATIVFDGLLPMPTTSTDGYTITFSQPYTYSGGNLLIGVYNDDKGTYNSVTWFGKTGLTSGVSAYGNNSSSLASVGYTAQSFLPKTTFNYTPGSAPSCLPPTGLAATEDQPNQSVLSWTANNGETSWNIYYKKASAASYTEIADVTDNPYTLPNLEPATQYLYYVVANCTETSDPSAVFPFTTACGIISTFPWTENFDSYAGVTSGSTNNLPLCWNYLNNCTYSSYQGYPVVYNASASSYSGNNHLRFYSSSSYPATEYAILPEMQSLDGKMITFYARYYNYKTDLVVGVMTDPTDATTFSAVETISDLTTSYKKYTVNFDAVTGNYIAFKMVGNYSYSYYIYIDNLEVKQQPDCATPTGLAVTANSQTPEGATITWTAGDASSWIVEYKTSTDENYTAIAEPVNEATYTFTGLNYSTTYNVRVKVNCTAGSGVTYPTEPVNFTTKVQFPAPTNFETSDLTHNSVTLAWTAGYTNQTAWKVEYKKSSDEWAAAVTETANTPTINLAELVANTTYNVRIYGGIGENFGTDYLSGDFTTKNPNAAPTDFVVSNLTASSATISWTPGYTTQDHWTVEYKKSSEEWTAATSETVTNPTINLDNLDGLTTYNVRIYYVETYKLIGNFTTYAGTPFTEGFTTTSVPTEWTRYSGKMSEVLAGTTTLSTYNGGWNFNTHNNVFNNHAYCNTYNTWYYWLVTPGVVLGNNECHVSFDVAFTAWSGDNSAPNIGDDDMFAVLVSTDDGATWTLIAAWDKTGTDNGRKLSDLSNGNDAISTLMSFDLSSYSNQTVKVAFYSQGTDTSHDNCIHVDNVEIDINQDCDKPVLTLDDKTDTTADFSWTDGDGTTTWTLNYKKTADEDWTAVNGIATNSYQIPNLEAETSYDVRVLASCNIYWSNTVTFETASACETPDGLAASNVTTSSADISWNTYGQTVFNLRYGTDGENWTVKNNVSTPCSLTELTGAKVYKVQVQAACNTEVWSTTLEFQTPFEITELTPFFEDFEGYTGATYSETGVVPDCWSSYKGGAYYYPHIISQGTYNYATSGNVLALSGGSYSPYYSYVALPLFSNDLDELQITFKWATYSSYYGTLALGYIKETDNGQFNTFTVIKSYSASTSSYRALIQADLEYLNELPSDAYRLAFRWYGSNSSYYFCNIDDVEVSLLPSCWPVTLGENTTTASTATLNWTAGHDETAWNIRWREEGSTGAYSTATATTTTYTITTGLQASTTYEYGVQADCGSGDESEWVSDTFTTKCDATDVDKEHPFFEGFEGDVFPPDCWTRGNTYSSGTTDYWNSSTDHPYNNSSKSAYSYYYGPIELYTPTLNITGYAAYLTFWSYNTYPNSYDKNSVLISVDGGAFTEIWSPNSVSQSWVPTTIDLASYIGHDIVFGFKYEGDNDHGWYLDDVAVTVYDNVFTTEGDWTTAANWSAGTVPAQTDDVYINANATISTTTTATANNITVADGKTITIEDGGQLKHNNEGVIVNVKKDITGFGEGNDKWYLIASPWAADNVPLTNAEDLKPTTDEDYDLFKFDYTAESEEWQNYKKSHFNYLTNGEGYLYANRNNVTVNFKNYAVKASNTPVEKAIAYTNEGTQPFNGWNLIGNPFVCNAYINRAHYVMNDEGTAFVPAAANDPIAPCTGVFVQATTSDETVSFNREVPTTSINNDNIMIAVKSTERGVNDGDCAIVNFRENDNLEKFILNDKYSKLYIPQGSSEYAVVSMSEDVQQFNLNFKAKTTRHFSLSVSKEGNFSYLHLIDRMTGEDVDMLIEDEYIFIGSPRDDENRFIVKLRYNANGSNGTSDIFAYQNGDEIIVNGEGELQVYDVMGRFVASFNVNGNKRINASQFSNAVYIFRLVGTDVKTQKIVVR